MATKGDKKKAKAGSKKKSGPPKRKNKSSGISDNPGAALSLLARARRGR